jgi:hypothetical protein
MRALTERGDEPRTLTSRRLLGLTVAVLIAPCTLVVQLVLGVPLDAWALRHSCGGTGPGTVWSHPTTSSPPLSWSLRRPRRDRDGRVSSPVSCRVGLHRSA